MGLVLSYERIWIGDHTINSYSVIKNLTLIICTKLTLKGIFIIPTMKWQDIIGYYHLMAIREMLLVTMENGFIRSRMLADSKKKIDRLWFTQYFLNYAAISDI